MSTLIRRTIPLILVAIFSLFLTFSFFISGSPEIAAASKMLKNWGTTIIGINLMLAVAYLTRRHVRHLIRRTRGQWFYSLTLLAVMLPFLAIGILYGTRSDAYLWIFNVIYQPLNSSVFSFLAFYCVSAIYRTFRARSWETTVLVTAAIFVFFTCAPLLAGGFDPLSDIGLWVMGAPNKAAGRALTIGGLGIGLTLLSLRTIFGYEKGWMGER